MFLMMTHRLSMQHDITFEHNTICMHMHKLVTIKAGFFKGKC